MMEWLAIICLWIAGAYLAISLRLARGKGEMTRLAALGWIVSWPAWAAAAIFADCYDELRPPKAKG